jgi:hypothetical protein
MVDVLTWRGLVTYYVQLLISWQPRVWSANPLFRTAVNPHTYEFLLRTDIIAAGHVSQ